MVSNIPSDGTGNARSCAEHAVLLTLATLRDLPGCCLAIQERRLGEPCGETLFGKQVLVLGYGNIARELIPLLHAFGASVTCVRRSPWQQEDQVCAGSPSASTTRHCRPHQRVRGPVNWTLLHVCLDMCSPMQTLMSCNAHCGAYRTIDYIRPCPSSGGGTVS